MRQQRDRKPSPRPEKQIVNRGMLPALLRVFLAFIFFVLQIVGGTLLSNYLRTGGYAIYTLFQILSFIIVLFILRHDRAMDYTLAWSVAILALPFVGLILYVLWGSSSIFRKPRARLAEAEARLRPLRSDPSVQIAKLQQEGLLDLNSPEALQIQYLASQGFPAYAHCQSRYYPDAEGFFKDLLQDLTAAKRYIFLEYFIIADGSLWSSMEQVLLKKVREGVDIRLMVDDFGAAPRAPRHLADLCEREGISLLFFNPVLRYMSRFYANYRNHRKLCVIDGSMAYFGGANLADEYVNLAQRFGHWKDVGLRLQGAVCREAAFSFLSLWEEESRLPTQDFLRYLPDPKALLHMEEAHSAKEEQALCVPYHDSPLNNPQNTALDVYLSLINSAHKRLYIVSPYFIVPQQMLDDICRVASSGVDVRLILPGTPDKRYVYIISRSYYAQLMQSGVRIYEYSPGFIHAKSMVVDGRRAVTGSINLDYRSLFLNFENAVYLANTPVIKDMEDDFLETLEACEERRLEDWKRRHVLLKLAEGFLRIFAPLL